MNQFRPPNSSDDLCLFICLYPSSMVLTIGIGTGTVQYSVHCEISQIQRCNFELNYEYFFKNNDFSVGGEEVLVDMRSWDGPVQPKVVAPLAHQTEVESRRLAQLSSSMPTKTAKRRLRLQRRV